MMRGLHIGCMVIATMLMVGCLNISCPLENTVAVRSSILMDGMPYVVTDTLTVTAQGTDSILLNRLYRFSDFQLPMSPSVDGVACDTFVLHWSRPVDEETSLRLLDTLYVNHTSRVHFESIDCPPAVFHNIVDVRSTNVLIDHVEMTNPNVGYEEVGNLLIHLRLSNQ